MNGWLSWGEVAPRAVRTDDLVICIDSIHFSIALYPQRSICTDNANQQESSSVPLPLQARSQQLVDEGKSQVGGIVSNGG